MASINVSQKDFDSLANAAMEAAGRRDMDEAKALDKLARKVNAALANATVPTELRRAGGPAVRSLTWRDVPSVIATYGVDSSGESSDLDPRMALDYAKRMKTYCESFNGRDWGLVMLHGSTDEQNLAHALDNLTECAAMLMNMAERVAAPDECGTCRKALPEGCSTEFQGEANCALTHGVDLPDGGKHG